MLDAPARPPRTRLPQDKRREQLMDAALSAIAECGLTKVTLGKVAERAGLTAGMVNFHFETKQDLLEATLARQAAEMLENLDKGIERSNGSPAAALTAMVIAAFDPRVFSEEKLTVLQAFWGAGSANPHYMAICKQSAAAFRDRSGVQFDRLAEATGATLDTRVAPHRPAVVADHGQGMHRQGRHRRLPEVPGKLVPGARR
jgi:AcrR family transcriptional regulator